MRNSHVKDTVFVVRMIAEHDEAKGSLGETFHLSDCAGDW